MKTSRLNFMILACNLIFSMVVIYLSPRFDLFTLLGFGLVNIGLYALLAYKDRQVEKKMEEKIEGVFQLLHSLDPNDHHYELVDDDFGKLRDEIVKVISENKLLTKRSKENQEILREYTEDIAHQIKTPLTGALLMLDLMEENPENSKEYIAYLGQSMNRLHGLADALLKMASLDSGTLTMKRELVNVKEMLEHLLVELAGYFKEQELVIPILGDNFNLICDEQWTYEAVFNIVKNAIEASQEKGVEIELKETNIYKSLIVRDFSPGLSREQLKKVYKRFYKENSETSGFGIGLPMAKSIMEKQEGELLYQRGKNSNSFEMRFYK